MSDVKGVVVVIVIDGRVIAHAADFDLDWPAGFNTFEAQRISARNAATREFVRALASPILVETMSQYECDRVAQEAVRINKGEIKIIPIGHKAEDE